MLSEETKRKIKHIQIRTKKILSTSFLGNFNSSIKGSGFEFDQIREYIQGDDVRFVDWKSSAKADKLLIKQYYEEKNRNIILAIDISSSTLFTSNKNRKYEIMAQIACVLALVAEHGKDNLGLLLFSDKINEYISPNNSKKHIAQIIEKIFSINSQNRKTNINLALEYLGKNIKKNSLIILISDLIDENNFENNLKAISKKYNFIIIRCTDEFEQNLPEIGLLNIQNFETEKTILLDLRSKNQNMTNSELENYLKNQTKILKKSGIPILSIDTKKDYLFELVDFFKKLN